MALPPRLVRRSAELLPAGLAQLIRRYRLVMNPKPWPWDLAAVELYKAERRGQGVLEYPSYLYGLLAAARTCTAIGAKAFTAVEFGVAGGNGLRAMEEHADQVSRLCDVDISIVGLDSGTGLLEPTDPRDCGFALRPGEFRMDEAQLRSMLRRAELVIGPVEQTAVPFMDRIADGELPPLGFVAHDLDVFTGTLAALKAMPEDPQRLLPRVPIYFDDLTGYPYTSETGEAAAISAFNASYDDRRIGKVENLEHSLGGTAHWQNWPRHVFVLHLFDHPRYGAPETTTMPDLSLDPPKNGVR